MKIELHEISIRELSNGYQDNAENGVKGYSGKLDIRPPYQREFVYKDKQRDAVITTVLNKFPLNVMYWATREDGTYEIIDGQQRTISICQYINNDFSYNCRLFYNLTDDEKKEILDYKVMVYICIGTDSEKLNWFTTINIAGEKLTNQELLNAVYAGSFVNDAKRYFSKNGCAAQKMASDLLNGSAIRQEYFETALKWICNAENLNDIRLYLSKHQHDLNANKLWQYFNSVITWVDTNFDRKFKKYMKGVEWGLLYNKYKDFDTDKNKISKEVSTLLMDDDVTNKKGIFEYILSRNEKFLSIRTFSPAISAAVYEEQKGICPICGNHFDIEFMEADHITPWSKGGKTLKENCQMLCAECNRRKSNI